MSIVANVFNKIYIFFNHDSLSFNRFEIFISRMVEIYSNLKRICKKKERKKKRKIKVTMERSKVREEGGEKAEGRKISGAIDR